MFAQQDLIKPVLLSKLGETGLSEQFPQYLELLPPGRFLGQP
jgi:hypothetical protein